MFKLKNVAENAQITTTAIIALHHCNLNLCFSFLTVVNILVN